MSISDSSKTSLSVHARAGHGEVEEPITTLEDRHTQESQELSQNR